MPPYLSLGFSYLWSSFQQRPAFCAIGKDAWYERKTKDAFGFVPHSVGGIQIKDTAVGSGRLAKPGSIVGAYVVFTASVTDIRSLSRRRINFILDEPCEGLASGVHEIVRGMKEGSERLALLPPETTDNQYSHPVFCRVALRCVREGHLTDTERRTLGKTRFRATLIRLRLEEVYIHLKRLFFNSRELTFDEKRSWNLKNLTPAVTLEDFLGENLDEKND